MQAERPRQHCRRYFVAGMGPALPPKCLHAHSPARTNPSHPIRATGPRSGQKHVHALSGGVGGPQRVGNLCRHGCWMSRIDRRNCGENVEMY